MNHSLYFKHYNPLIRAVKVNEILRMCYIIILYQDPTVKI